MTHPTSLPAAHGKPGKETKNGLKRMLKTVKNMAQNRPEPFLRVRNRSGYPAIWLNWCSLLPGTVLVIWLLSNKKLTPNFDATNTGPGPHPWAWGPSVGPPHQSPVHSWQCPQSGSGYASYSHDAWRAGPSNKNCPTQQRLHDSPGCRPLLCIVGTHNPCSSVGNGEKSKNIKVWIIQHD